ncbi:MAG: four-carbon acid sugar kinase family protein [Alphaproteobacteria bacterium]|nr:four-carbon acid sugar kinase family protein [Alphaproteobacteria bacterium]
MKLLLGAIADDFTGASDLANTLVRQGMRTVQLFGVPSGDRGIDAVDAVVVALKSRTAPLRQAVADSLAALAWLQRQGAAQFFFKYCSTFDSTPDGNIGPVAEALLQAVGEDFTLYCPAFPENGRTICHGHLFVGDALLSDSSMKDHPLTPMTDANLVRWLGRQTRHPVGLVRYDSVAAGVPAIAAAFAKLRAEGKRHAVVDALSDRDLVSIGEAAADLRLITGGSGVALGLPENFRRRGKLGAREAADRLPPVSGPAAVLAGSCSQVTRGQVAEMARTRPAFRIDSAALARRQDVVGEALAWAKPRLADGPVLIYSSAAPEEVARAQAEFGREPASRLVEEAMASLASALVGCGVRRLVVAGGETAGAVVQRLGLSGIRIGPQIDPGVPWTLSLDEPPLALALKSGNFGAPDFFLKALRLPR